MNKYLILSLLTIVNFAIAQQTCRTELEIPSTASSTRFIDNNDGTITDRKTNLMWQKCPLSLSGKDCKMGDLLGYNWQEALDEASANTLLSFIDWRVPNIKELSGIIEFQCTSPSLNLNVFSQHEDLEYFWSSSPYADDSNSSWVVDFFEGQTYSIYRNEQAYVRLVR